MNALEAVRTDSETQSSEGVEVAEPQTSPVNREFLKMSLANCTAEHDIFMTRFINLRNLLDGGVVTDEQIRQAHAKLKRSMTDFRTSLKSIPGKL